MYHGAITLTLSSHEFVRYECTYHSFEDLSLFIESKANALLGNDGEGSCLNFRTPHNHHNFNFDNSVNQLCLSYVNGKFLMKIGKGCMLVLSANLIKFLGFHDEIMNSVKETEKTENSVDKILRNFSTPLRFKKSVYLSKEIVDFIPAKERKLYFAFNNMIDVNFIYDCNRYNVLFSYDRQKNICPEAGKLAELKHLTNPVFNEIQFTVYHSDFRYFDVSLAELRKEPIQFVLAIYQKH